MSKSIDVLFQLLRISLGGCNESIPSAVNWQDVMDVASSQNVLALAFDALEVLPSNQRPDMDTFMDWLGQTSYLESIFEEQWKAAKELAEAFHNEGLRTFVLKGFSLAVLYPKPSHRSGCDLDCFLLGAKDKGDAIVESLGINVDKSYYKNSKFTFRGLSVENHLHLLPVKGSKKAKRFEKSLLEKMLFLEPEYIWDSKLESPTPMFLAIHTLAHAQEHFFEEGINLRHLCDWGIILKCCNVDWNECHQIFKKYGLLEFCYAMSRLAKKVCGVEIPFECQSTGKGSTIEKADLLFLKDIMTVKQSDADDDNHRRIELITNIFRDSWKFKYFSDTNALMFALRRIKGYLFE